MKEPRLTIGGNKSTYYTPETVSSPSWRELALKALDLLHDYQSHARLISPEREKYVELCKSINQAKTAKTNCVEAIAQALETAVNTVECASIDPVTKQELPWYKMAKAALHDYEVNK